MADLFLHQTPSRCSTPYDDELRKLVHPRRVFQEIVRLENPKGKVVPGGKVAPSQIISKRTFGTHSFYLQGYLRFIPTFYIPSILFALDSIPSPGALAIASMPVSDGSSLTKLW